MIQITVLTIDSGLSTYIGSNKTRLVGDDIRRKALEDGHELSVNSVLIELEKAEEQLSEYFIQFVDGDNLNVMSLFDHRIRNVAEKFSRSFFSVEFSLDSVDKAQNYFRKITARSIRQFLFYLNRFSEEKYRRLLNLPLGNFVADEICELKNIFSFVEPSNHEFPTEVDRLLAKLRQRQRPKTDKGYRDVYLVDDIERYFIYGLERHKPVETGRPPHGHPCKTNAYWRFGGKYDARRHYNVSVEAGRISGDFMDCHGSRKLVTPVSHLNLFPNDFF